MAARHKMVWGPGYKKRKRQQFTNHCEEGMTGKEGDDGRGRKLESGNKARRGHEGGSDLGAWRSDKGRGHGRTEGAQGAWPGVCGSIRDEGKEHGGLG